MGSDPFGETPGGHAGYVFFRGPKEWWWSLWFLFKAIQPRHTYMGVDQSSWWPQMTRLVGEVNSFWWFPSADGHPMFIGRLINPPSHPQSPQPIGALQGVPSTKTDPRYTHTHTYKYICMGVGQNETTRGPQVLVLGSNYRGFILGFHF